MERGSSYQDPLRVSIETLSILSVEGIKKH